MSEVIEKQITERYPYPANPFDAKTDLKKVEWGYVIFYSDGSSTFVNEKPSRAEILEAIQSL